MSGETAAAVVLGKLLAYAAPLIMLFMISNRAAAYRSKQRHSSWDYQGYQGHDPKPREALGLQTRHFEAGGSHSPRRDQPYRTAVACVSTSVCVSKTTLLCSDLRNLRLVQPFDGKEKGLQNM